MQDRESIQESFCAGKTKVVVATVAFGMGVDAQGVRGVIHTTLPRSLEEYVQQVPCHVVTVVLDRCNAIIYYTFLALVTRWATARIAPDSVDPVRSIFTADSLVFLLFK